MTVRVCLGCRLPEARGVDAAGRPTVNLNPLTDLCVTCTVSAALEAKQGWPAEPLPFDARAAAANDRGEE
jgi:hypothetical protein